MSARAAAAQAGLLRALFRRSTATSAFKGSWYFTGPGPGGDGHGTAGQDGNAAEAAEQSARSVDAFTAPRHSSKPALSQKVRFIDRLMVEVAAGKGGGGASSLFGRTGKHPRAAGGHGGKGGDVILRGTRQLLGLGGTPRHIDGNAGGHGGKQWMEGKAGESTIVDVPLGTLVWELAELEGPATTQIPPPPTRFDRRGSRDGYQSAGPYGVRALQPEEFWWEHEEQQQRPAVGSGLGRGGLEVPGQVLQPTLTTPPPPPAAGRGGEEGLVEEMAVVGEPDALLSQGFGRRRRRLFDRHDVNRPANEEAAAAVAALATASVLPAASSSRGTSSSQTRSVLNHLTAEQEGAAADDMGLIGVDDESEELFQQLLSGKRPLTAQEKRQLWLTGGLEAPPPMWPEDEVQEVDEAPPLRPTRRQRRKEKREKAAAAAAAAEDLQNNSVGEDEEQEEEEEEEEEGEETPNAWLWPRDDEEPQFSRRKVRTLLESTARLLGEITEDGQTLTVAAGGCGGRGNSTAPSKPYGPASRWRTDGAPGQRRVLLLETRLIADVVLVGLPNVGKSSLVAALTGARAQIGAYAFTTLRPQLGALRFPDGGALTVADVPGLLEGAHAGRGRGAAFLTHLRKARVLALVVDLSGGREGALVDVAPAEQVEVLRSELHRFDPTLTQLPWLVVANKTDCLDASAARGALQQLKGATAAPIVPVSAVQEGGLGRLAAALRVLAGPGSNSSNSSSSS